MDGSPARDEWFAVGIQNPVPVGFLRLDDALKRVENAAENEEGNREYWQRVEKLGNLTRDPKIAPDITFPIQWWAFAVNDCETTVMLDMRPSQNGKLGQIIVYYHDPDALICVADNFLEFFRKSNDFLETRWEKIFSDEN
jgi:cell wall assembly regulator SMI1